MDQTRCQQQQMTSCLKRFRSAPNSYFDTILSSTRPPPPPTAADGRGGYARDDFDHLLSARRSGPNIQQAFARLIASMGARDSSSCSFSSTQQNQHNPASNLDVKPQFVAPLKQEPEAYLQAQQQSSSAYGSVSQMNSSSHAQQSRNYEAAFSAVDNSYGLMSSVNPGCIAPTKMSTGVGNSNITSYNSSPAGFFDQINIENEYGAMGGRGNYGGAGSNANAEASFSSPDLFKNHMESSSGYPPSSSGQMASISEIRANAVKEETCLGDASFNEGQTNDENYLSSFPIPSWDDSDILSDDFLKVTDEKPFLNVKAPDVKNTEGRSRPPALLSHHLSLPKSSAELPAILQDSVPCGVRAKRGCATHPRSIAERVRRTRISERMRKLQELVPNMDKQTNTADMLDLAVDYIKDLEKQVKRLADNRAKCTCTNK